MSARLVALVRTVVLLAGLAVAIGVGAGRAGAAVALGEEPPPPITTPGSFVDNEFIPTEENLTDCVSAVPRPGCGSDNRSGWRQFAILAALVAGLSFIAWRIVRSARRARRTRDRHRIEGARTP